ncbi:hypothetical protein ACJRO7_023441 [Eucalyptus globulus]|uniref:Uncharacterized protein n=1 Tax=Eucalyptus globulus TaxID=34317 RepID=A0ABD3K262_EUCGL
MTSTFSKADDNGIPVAHGKRIPGEVEDKEEEEEDAEETTADNLAVTTHVYIKPAHSSQVLDRDAVLRRIRLRKAMNGFRSSLQSLFGSSPGAPATAKKTKKASVTSGNTKRWIDDAFAAP